MSYCNHTKTKITERTRLEDLPAYLTPYEVCRITRRSRGAVYKAIKKGTIPSIRVGERGFLVPAAHFAAVASLASRVESQP
jgi:excisionase family DNA binding protein